VHIWSLLLDLPDTTVEKLTLLLSPDELTRAARYRSAEVGRRFVACRGQVRQILAAYLNEQPALLRFHQGPQGKPALDLAQNAADLRFNVTNSKDLALCAVVLRHEIGIDVEFVRAERDLDTLAERFFAKREVDELRALPEPDRLNAFYHCWTRKEAVLKAVGTGLAFPLGQIVVSIDGTDPARVVSFAGDPAASANWWLAHLEPASGYLGAVAAPVPTLMPICWQWTPEI
jgi:4'-phosphopantetheinyl transferase